MSMATVCLIMQVMKTRSLVPKVATMGPRVVLHLDFKYEILHRRLGQNVLSSCTTSFSPGKQRNKIVLFKRKSLNYDNRNKCLSNKKIKLLIRALETCFRSDSNQQVDLKISENLGD